MEATFVSGPLDRGQFESMVNKTAGMNVTLETKIYRGIATLLGNPRNREEMAA